MPRIRKKTSKRISTHQRAKFKHKVAEGRKKKKKEAKKNPQWKSKKKKDPGIPNNFPYKDQILAEIAETRREAEEEKQRRKEERKAAREGLPVEVEDVQVDGGSSGKGPTSHTQTKDEAPLLLNPELSTLKAVLEKADVVLHVLDARDPSSHRLPHMEELAADGEKSKLVFVLNKIDLVPREASVAWAKYLRTQHPTFLFRSASSFLPKPTLNDPKAKGKGKETGDDSLGSGALLEYLGQRASAMQRGSESLQVAVVGLTNSGKSAVVNSLAGKGIVPVYAPSSSTDAWATTTTRAFEVVVEVGGHRLNVVDTPGVSLHSDDGQEQDEGVVKTRDMLLRSRGRVDKVKDPVPAVEHIVSRADTQDLMVHYNLPAFAPGDCGAFLAGVARAGGLLKKGGDADLTQAARGVLRDWTTGKLPFYTEPPAGEVGEEVSGEDGGLEELYGRGDAGALAGTRGKREMRKAGGLVRAVRGAGEQRRVVLDALFVVEEGDGSEGGSEEGSEGEGASEGEGGSQGESNEDAEMQIDGEEPANDGETARPALSGKRKRAEGPPARGTKKVAFAAGTRDGPERRQMRSASKGQAAKIQRASKGARSVAGPKSKTAKTGGTSDTYDFEEFFRA